MIIRAVRFNLYLLVGLSLLAACQSPEEKRQAEVSTLRVYLEAPQEQTNRSQVVNISRGNPIPIQVLKEFFLHEAYISKAQVVDGVGGFHLQVEFNRHGAWLLEQQSAANPGKHLVIYSEFMQPATQLHESRWLAAPKIQRRISDGKLVFTPDATREEAEQIVVGLMNVAKKNANDETSKW